MPSFQNGESSCLFRVSEILDEPLIHQNSSTKSLTRDHSSEVLVKKRVVTSPRKQITEPKMTKRVKT